MSIHQRLPGHRPATAKSPKWSKVPSPSEVAEFGGMHCAALYRDAVARSWRCPSCRRSAHELIRWSYINGPSWRARYGDEHGMGWTISMCRHHCHSYRRFEETLICGDCNSADGAAKRKLRLPREWSFRAEEIGSFVTVSPYSGKTVIDYERAQEIFNREYGA